MNPTVLHCYADCKWTGPSEPVALLCRALMRRGWRVQLACTRPGSADGPTLAGRARWMGVPVDDGFHFDGVSGGWPREVRRLSRLIQDGGFSIVHSHGSWDNLLAAAALRRGPRRLPLMRTDHKGRLFKGTPLERLQFSRAMSDHLMVLSDLFRARSLERLGRAPGSVTTVRGAVDVEEYRPRTPPEGLRARLGLGVSDVVFALVARVQPHRRFGVLLEAARIVLQADPRVKIIVLGRGTRRQKLLDRPLARMGLAGTVYPLGYRTEDYKDVLAVADAGLMLVPGSDGSCSAAMQLAAMGKPMLVARRGVLPDIVRDGETGMVVTDTPGSLAEAMLEMASLSPEQRRDWGRASRQRMVDFFSIERQADAVIEAYKGLLGRQAAASPGTP